MNTNLDNFPFNDFKGRNWPLIQRVLRYIGNTHDTDVIDEVLKAYMSLELIDGYDIKVSLACGDNRHTAQYFIEITTGYNEVLEREIPTIKHYVMTHVNMKERGLWAIWVVGGLFAAALLVAFSFMARIITG